ncbi:MAG: hypothetical protein P1P89_09275 [Desulfobacterales bacterium]|nr:hypothetical protein [Desulfobacterales bacterium]
MMIPTQLKNSDATPPRGLKPLKVVSFWDGRLGHEKQTRGVLAALAKLMDIGETAAI